MSDKTTLAGLRVFMGFGSEGRDDEMPTPLVTRPATTQDLIEAVESIGGQIVGTMIDSWGLPVIGYGDNDYIKDNGRYLILRIEEDE